MMNEQGSLFALPQAREPPPAPRPCRRTEFEFSPLRHPGGSPDKRGKYPYEKFHREAVKFGEAARVRFFETLLSMDATMFSQIIEIGVLWNRLPVNDQMDYEDAIRLRG